MDDIESRLTACFNTVFPRHKEIEFTSASMATLKEWDSLKMITLIVVIEEEFEVAVPVEEIENLTSFQALHDYLQHSPASSD
jgi:acyl carrier protein